MTHFLFLEKGARLRDAERIRSDKSARRRSARRGARPIGEAGANPTVLLLMLPSADGYRVLRAELEEVLEIPASELGDHGASIDVAARVVTLADTVVALAPLEFDLLLALVVRQGAAASRRELLREVWGTRNRCRCARSTRTSRTFGERSRPTRRTRVIY